MLHPPRSRKTPAQRARRKLAAEAARTAGLPGSPARKTRSIERRDAILSAALDEFSIRGFEATRLDDIARRAGVAKGTIYLYFRDKESLFQDLVRAMLSPIIARLEAAPAAEVPARMAVEAIADMFVREVFGTRRKDVIRL